MKKGRRLDEIFLVYDRGQETHVYGGSLRYRLPNVEGEPVYRFHHFVHDKDTKNLIRTVDFDQPLFRASAAYLSNVSIAVSSIMGFGIPLLINRLTPKGKELREKMINYVQEVKTIQEYMMQDS